MSEITPFPKCDKLKLASRLRDLARRLETEAENSRVTAYADRVAYGGEPRWAAVMSLDRGAIETPVSRESRVEIITIRIDYE